MSKTVKKSKTVEKESNLPKPEAPTPTTGRFVRLVLGFGVWVALGLSPFLGMVDLPVFSSLLSLYPQSLHWVIPLSGLLMGAVAMAIEFAAGDKWNLRSIRRGFGISLAVFFLAFLTLLFVYPQWIARVEVPAAKRIASFVTGPELPANLPDDCECESSWVREKCLAAISFKPSNIETCFGQRQILQKSQILVLLYLLLTTSFATCGGMLVLREQRSARLRGR